MKHSLKQALSLLLALIMMIGLMPSGFALEPGEGELAIIEPAEEAEPVISLVGEEDPAPAGDRDAPVIVPLEDDTDDPAEPDLAPLPDEPQDGYAFTTQPAGLYDGSLDQGRSFRVIWETTFVPTQVEIGWKDSSGEWHKVKTITASLTASMSCGLPLSYAIEGDMYVRAYYSEYTTLGDFIESSPFQLPWNQVRFTTQPAGLYDGSLDQGRSFRVIWETTFVPTQVEIGWKDSSGEWHKVKTITASLTASMSCGLPLSYAIEGDMYVRAYYSEYTTLGDFIESSPFQMPWDEVGFTIQPYASSYDVTTNRYTFTWRTSYVPTEIVIEIQTDSGWVTYGTIQDPGRNESYQFPQQSAPAVYRVSAFYSTFRSIPSDEFCVNSEAPPLSGDCGWYDPEDVHWELDLDSGVLNITGSGAMQGFNAANVPWIFFRDYILTVNVGEGVTNVGACAFYKCSNLATVTLPSTLTAIGDYAFDGCPALADAHINMAKSSFAQYVSWDKTKNPGLDAAEKHFSAVATGQAGPNLTWTLSNSYALSFSGSGAMYNWTSASQVPWYSYRNSIQTLSLSNAATVGDYAFYGCTKITAVTIPSSLTYLGRYAFSGCTALATVQWTGVYSVNVTEISNYAFSGCFALKAVTIPEKVTRIGASAFRGCHALTTVSFTGGSALTSVGNYAFADCGALTSINLPDAVTALGEYCFYNCTSLTAFPLPASLETVGKYCFANCTGVTATATVPAGVAAIPERCFLNCSGFYTLELKPGLTEIGDYAFYGCAKLMRVDYDGFARQWEGVSIGSHNEPLTNAALYYLYRYGTLSNSSIHWALYGATGKLEIYGTGSMPNWPGTPQSAPWYQYAPYIEIIDVHASVETIGAYNFRNCTALKTLYLPRTLTQIGSFAFTDSTSLADVWYDGPRVDWDEVNVYSGNAALTGTGVTWHFTTLGGPVTYYDGSGTDLYWTLDDDGVLTVFHDPDNLDWYEMAIPDYQDPTMAPWYPYREMIHAIRVQEDVTAIGGGAFTDIPDLREVEIAGDVTEIGDYVFEDCGGSFSVTIPDSVTEMGIRVFQNSGLTSAVLPAGLTKIPYGTFLNCANLTTVTIPATVANIADNAFSGCTGLRDVYFDGTSAQWALVAKGSGNDALNTATIHFVPPEIKVDAINFPDANFRAWVAANVDTDGSGWLTDEERLAVTRIECDNKDIASLQGIAFFPRLVVLKCSGNSLTELDLGANPRLMNLYCADNPLGQLDLGANPALTYVDCINCGLTELNVSQNAALWQLDCNNNALTELDLSGISALGRLNCAGNHLAALDLSANTGLIAVDCSGNGMTALTLGQQETLCQLSCYGNALAIVDLTECALLKNVVLNGSRTEYNTAYGHFLEFRSEDDYIRVDPGTVLMTTLDGIPVDEEHFPDDNFRAYVAATLDPNGDLWLTRAELAAVTEIVCQEADIASLEGVEYFTNLEILMCGFNDLAELDLSANIKLKELSCEENDLTALDLSMLPDLETLGLSGNPELSELDVSHNPLLADLSVQSCGLSELDLSANPALWYLDCVDNGLTELDLSYNPALEELYCNNNVLTALDLTGCSALRIADCYENVLTALDLSGCPALTELHCEDNALTGLTLGEQPALKELYCYHNSLTRLDLTGCPLVLDMVLTTERIEYSDFVYYTKTTDAGVLCEFDVDPGVLLVTELHYAMVGFEITAAGVAYVESRDRYELDGRVHTPVWQDGNAPDFNGITHSFGAITLNESGTQVLKTEPEVGGIYYFSCDISTVGQGQGTVDFSPLNTGNCTLTVPGYEISCIRVTQTTTSGGYDKVVILFKLCRLLPVTETYFPDDNFRAYVAAELDLDHSGYLSDAEIEAVKHIDVDDLHCASLVGIEYFCELASLNADYNDLTTLDLYNNTALKSVSLFGNHLTSLNLTGLDQLEWLSVEENYCLAALDLSSNTALKSVWLEGNLLTELDVSMLPALEVLDVSDNELTELDVSANTALTTLYCVSDYELTELTLGELPALKTLHCYYDPALDELDVSGCPILVDAVVNGERIEDEDTVKYLHGPLAGWLWVDLTTRIVTEAAPGRIPGDIDGNGKVELADVILLARYVKANCTGYEIVPGSGDVDGNGKVELADVILLARYVKAGCTGYEIH